VKSQQSDSSGLELTMRASKDPTVSLIFVDLPGKRVGLVYCGKMWQRKCIGTGRSLSPSNRPESSFVSSEQWSKDRIKEAI
jgi:hypothetical protein